jgi:hypothetical protein
VSGGVDPRAVAQRWRQGGTRGETALWIAERDGDRGLREAALVLIGWEEAEAGERRWRHEVAAAEAALAETGGAS